LFNFNAIILVEFFSPSLSLIHLVLDRNYSVNAVKKESVSACVGACVTILLHNFLDTFYGLNGNIQARNKNARK